MEKYLKEKEKEIFELLESIVNIDSGTYVKGGTDQVGKVLSEAYEKEGYHIQVHSEGEYGSHLQIRSSDVVNPKIMVIGHMDTVFPEGAVRKRPFSRDEFKAYGPGISDMKASLISVFYALKLLKEMGDSSYKNVEVFMNSDEEISSPTSRKLIEDSARSKDYALVVEPSRGAKDYIVTERKSISRFYVKITGKGSHAGSNPEEGVSAIEELGHKIVEIQALNDYARGISVNVGLVEGGTSANTVPPESTATIDVRTKTLVQAEEIAEKIEEICSNVHVKGTNTELSGGLTRPPMVKDHKVTQLLKIVQEAGEEVGVKIEDTKTGGGSDGCFTAAIIPTIDGMGPAGGGAHSDREFLKIPTFFERTQVLAKTIKKLSESPLV